MSRYQHQKRPAPRGMATAMELARLRQDEARFVRGFLPGRYGSLYPSHLLEHVNRTHKPMPIHGLAWYNDRRTPTASDAALTIRTRSRLLTFSTFGNTITVYAPRWLGAHDYMELEHVMDLPLPFDGPLATHDLQRMHDWQDRIFVLSAQYKDELFFCIGPSSYVGRFWADSNGQFHVARCGIEAPSDALSVASDRSWYEAVADGVTGLSWGTDYTYRLCWADERYRLSSPSDDVTVNTGPNPTRVPSVGRVACVIRWPKDLQVRYAVLYRATQGTKRFYACTPDGATSVWIERPAGAVVTTVYERTGEADLVLADMCPAPGENDPPAQASAMVVYRNRLWLNDGRYGTRTADGSFDYSDAESLMRVQISNLNSPTQFNSVPDVEDETLGGPLTISGDTGDRITAMAGIGSVLGIWSQSKFRYITGTSWADWTVEDGPPVGCVSPVALTSVQGKPFWLSVDGVYTFETGFTPVNISLRVNDLFGGAQGWLGGSIERTG